MNCCLFSGLWAVAIAVVALVSGVMANAAKLFVESATKKKIQVMQMISKRFIVKC